MLYMESGWVKCLSCVPWRSRDGNSRDWSGEVLPWDDSVSCPQGSPSWPKAEFPALVSAGRLLGDPSPALGLVGFPSGMFLSRLRIMEYSGLEGPTRIISS